MNKGLSWTGVSNEQGVSAERLELTTTRPARVPIDTCIICGKPAFGAYMNLHVIPLKNAGEPFKKRL